MSKLKDLKQKAREIKKQINQKQELADIKDFLDENEQKIVDSNNSFIDLFLAVGLEGNEETSKLRQATFMIAYIMGLIKLTHMPKEVKLNLIEQVNQAIREDKI